MWSVGCHRPRLPTPGVDKWTYNIGWRYKEVRVSSESARGLARGLPGPAPTLWLMMSAVSRPHTLPRVECRLLPGRTGGYSVTLVRYSVTQCDIV